MRRDRLRPRPTGNRQRVSVEPTPFFLCPLVRQAMILAEIKREMRHRGHCALALVAFEHRTRLSRGSVGRALRDLRNAGTISRTARPDGRVTTLLLPYSRPAQAGQAA